MGDYGTAVANTGVGEMQATGRVDWAGLLARPERRATEQAALPG